MVPSNRHHSTVYSVFGPGEPCSRAKPQKRREVEGRARCDFGLTLCDEGSGPTPAVGSAFYAGRRQYALSAALFQKFLVATDLVPTPAEADYVLPRPTNQ